MQTATRRILFVFSSILLVTGLVNVMQLVQSGEELQWRAPLLLLGFGVGLPTVLFIYPDLIRPESDSSESLDSGDDYGTFGGDGGAD